MMVEYGEHFWRDGWGSLYSVFGGNPLAAMPSLHFATSVMAALLLAEVGPVAGALGWAYAATLGFALVYLGEHYVVDLLAGAALTAAVRRLGAARGAGRVERVGGAVAALEAMAHEAAERAVTSMSGRSERGAECDGARASSRLAPGSAGATTRRCRASRSRAGSASPSALFVLSASRFLYFVLPQARRRRHDRAPHRAAATAGGSRSASCFEAAVVRAATSCCSGRCSCAARRGSAGARATRSRWPALAATRLFAAAGAGGVALTAWALRRSGMEPRLVACRMVAFIVLLYGVYAGSLLIDGIGLGTGLFPGGGSFAITIVPAIVGGAAARGRRRDGAAAGRRRAAPRSAGAAGSGRAGALAGAARPPCRRSRRAACAPRST